MEEETDDSVFSHVSTVGEGEGVSPCCPTHQHPRVLKPSCDDALETPMWGGVFPGC